jgi:hypothetical protein
LFDKTTTINCEGKGRGGGGAFSSILIHTVNQKKEREEVKVSVDKKG